MNTEKIILQRVQKIYNFTEILYHNHIFAKSNLNKVKNLSGKGRVTFISLH